MKATVDGKNLRDRMALQESLVKFNKQKERCQLISSSSVARAGSSKSNQLQTAANPSTSSFGAGRASAPAIKFSKDTERLQHIHSIRISPIGSQQKRVIDLLFERRQPLTAEQINEACYVDLNANKAVFDSLKNNIKVSYDEKHGQFTYKPTYDLKDKDQLLREIQKYSEGIAVTDLKDAYPTVLGDLQALKAANKVWLLASSDINDDMVYPNDPKIQVNVNDYLKQFFRETELPRDMIDIEKELQKNGMKPATNTAKRRAMAQQHGVTPKSKPKKKRREISKRTKLTNAHLPELFKILKSELDV